MAYRWQVWKKRFLTEPRRRIRSLLRPLRAAFRPADYGDLLKRVERIEQFQRNVLVALHPELTRGMDQRTALRRSEFRMLTEAGEAGILLHLFSRLGVTDRRVVEFGIGRVTKCNSANLALSFGWSALLMDGSPDVVESARRFFAEHARVDPARVRLVETWLTPENIDAVLVEQGFTGEIDLLSIDIDGNDYWVWKAIGAVSPRVVMVEYNASLGCDEPWITRYHPRFDRYALHPLGWYHGASLPALERLGRAKGYVLVGCNSGGMNAFFVRRDLAAGRFEALTAKEAFYPEARRLRTATLEEQIASLRALPLERDD